MFYPTKDDGDTWYASWDTNPRTLADGDRDPQDSRFLYTNGSPAISLFIEDDGHARVNDASVCTSIRLWVEHENTDSWKNTEMTVYGKRVNLADDIQLRARSNHTTTATENCQFGNYHVVWNDVGKFSQVEVEVTHPIYMRYIRQTQTPWVGFTNNVYAGYKQITRDVGDKVHVEGYYNPSIDDQSQWVKQTEFWFDGKNIQSMNPRIDDIAVYQNCLGKGERLCEDLNANTLYRKPGRWCWLRVNNVDKFNFRRFSIREIDAG